MYCDINSHIGEYTDEIKRFINSKVSDSHVAEDLTQEVLFELVKSCKKSDDIENVRSWMYQVARNVLYHHYKSNQLKEASYDPQDGYTNRVESDETVFELGKATEDLIQKLPEEYGQILIKSDIEEIKLQQIADEEGLSLSAVKMRVKRVRKLLFGLFQSNCDIEYDAQGKFVSCELKCC